MKFIRLLEAYTAGMLTVGWGIGIWTHFPDTITAVLMLTTASWLVFVFLAELSLSYG